jgi:hypothetical protein
MLNSTDIVADAVVDQAAKQHRTNPGHEAGKLDTLMSTPAPDIAL